MRASICALLGLVALPTLARSYAEVYGKSASSLSTCEEAFFDVEGGVAPYTVSVITNDGRTLVRWPDVHSSGLLSWRTNVEPYTQVRLLVRDAEATYFESDNMLVHEGLSTACLLQQQQDEHRIVEDRNAAQGEAPVRRIMLRRDGLKARVAVTITMTATQTATTGQCGYNCVVTTYATPTSYTFITPTTYTPPNTGTCPTVTVSTCPTIQSNSYSYQFSTTPASIQQYSTVSQSPVYTTYTLPPSSGVALRIGPIAIAIAFCLGTLTLRLL